MQNILTIEHRKTVFANIVCGIVQVSDNKPISVMVLLDFMKAYVTPTKTLFIDTLH